MVMYMFQVTLFKKKKSVLRYNEKHGDVKNVI